MKKIDLKNLPRFRWPKINEQEASQFYANRDPNDKFLAPGLRSNKDRGCVSPLDGRMKGAK
jgi:hypothetical protein